MSLIHRWDWNLSREEWSLRKLTPGKKQSVSCFRVYFAHDYVFFGRELKVTFSFQLAKTDNEFLSLEQSVGLPFSISVFKSRILSHSRIFPPFNLSKLLGNPHLFLFLKTSMFSQHEPLKYQGHHSAKNNNCVRKNELFML